MSKKASKVQSFQFVSVAPSATDDVSKAEQRRLVRSNAANYQWSRQKGRSKKQTSKSSVDATIASEDGSSGAAEEQAVADLSNEKVTQLNGNSIMTILPLGEQLPSVYETIRLLPDNGVPPLMRFSQSKMKILPFTVLMRFNIQFIIPHLVPRITKSIENPAAPAMIQLAMQSPVLYHTWMYCSAVYYDALRPWYTPSEVCEKDILFVHSRTIGLLNQEMQNLATACSDQNLLAVLGMAVHGREVPIIGQRTPNQGPMRDLQGLELYSLMKTVPFHLKGLALLVDMRGGLEAIEMQGIAAVISYMGIVHATKTLSKPRWPFIPLYKTLVPLDSMNTTFQPNHPLQDLGTGFHLENDDWPLEPVSELFSVIRAMCGYTIMIFNHCEGRAFQDSLCTVADQRNFIQHQLISLPHNPVDQPAFYDDGMYEAIRLAVTIYSLLVMFPASAAALPFVELSSQLQRQLSYLDISTKTAEELKPFIWILFMGGIAAIGSDQRQWFISTLTILSKEMDLKPWIDVTKILGTFLWLGRTNDTDGAELWDEVNELQYLDGINRTTNLATYHQ